MSLRDRIKRHEGQRFKPYRDTEGLLTVGYGRCMDRVPFSLDEIELMLTNDIRRAKDGAESFFVYSQLNDVRRGVLVEMIFQMGVGGVSKFKRFLAAALDEDWAESRAQMLDSKWAKQTPARANELADLFERG